MGQRNKSCPLPEQIETDQLPLPLPISKLMNYRLKSLALCTAGFNTKEEISDVYLTQMENDWGDKVLLLL